MEKFNHYYLPLIIEYIRSYAGTAIITASVETFFFFLVGYKKKGFLPFVFAINILTNLSLNITLSFLPENKNFVLWGELIVLIMEYTAFSVFLKPSFKECLRLFSYTIFSNLSTFGISLIFYYLLY